MLNSESTKLSPIKKLIEVVSSIDNQRVLCLVDSGATNNFISKHLADKLGLEITKDSTIVVKLADGNCVQSSAYTTCVLHLGQVVVQQRFEVLNADVATILGMPFLETCNPHINWARKTMKIKHKQRLIDIPTLTDACEQTVALPAPFESVAIENQFDALPVFDHSDDQLQVVNVDHVQCHKSRQKQKQTLCSQLDQCVSLQQMLEVCVSFDAAVRNDTSSAGAVVQGCCLEAPQSPVSGKTQSAEVTQKHVEQVPLHQFMRGLRKKQYAHAFVLLGQ